MGVVMTKYTKLPCGTDVRGEWHAEGDHNVLILIVSNPINVGRGRTSLTTEPFMLEEMRIPIIDENLDKVIQFLQEMKEMQEKLTVG